MEKDHKLIDLVITKLYNDGAKNGLLLIDEILVPEKLINVDVDRLKNILRATNFVDIEEQWIYDEDNPGTEETGRIFLNLKGTEMMLQWGSYSDFHESWRIKNIKSDTSLKERESQKTKMKIFISHSSANKDYGNALVHLLRGIGIRSDEIIYTSDSGYGIPIGQNIFVWLKTQIKESPFMIYLLSKEYYKSVACLNEMGAAWVIGNDHAVLFTPDFDIESKEFLNGAIDPRSIGFRITDKEKIFLFIELLQKHFTSITQNPVIKYQSVESYISVVASIPKNTNDIKENVSVSGRKNLITPISQGNVAVKAPIQTVTQKDQVGPAISRDEGIYEKFIREINIGKITDQELLLLSYMIMTSRTKLGTGWQEHIELDNIQTWEDIHEIKPELSSNYSMIIRKFRMRNFIEDSDFTSGGNPKQIKLKDEITENLLELPSEVTDKINTNLDSFKTDDDNDTLPF